MPLAGEEVEKTKAVSNPDADLAQRAKTIASDAGAKVDPDTQETALQWMLDDESADATLNRTIILSPAKGPIDPLARRDNDVMASISRVPILILHGQKLAALATCCDVQNWLAIEPGHDELKEKLLGMRRSLEHDLLVAGEMELIGEGTRIRPLAGRNVLIGRPSPSRMVDIAVNCRWFSRGERSLYLFSEGEDWFVEDLGSANGTFVGEKRLHKNEKFRIPAGESLIEIGRSSDAVAPVVVRLTRIGEAVLVMVQPGGAFKDPELKTWPTLHDDLKKRWLVFREECLLGADESQVLARSPAEAVASLAFRNGFWVSPMNGSEMQIDDLLFQTSVPLPAPSWFKAGALRLRAERLNNDTNSRAQDVRLAHD